MDSLQPQALAWVEGLLYYRFTGMGSIDTGKNKILIYFFDQYDFDINDGHLSIQLF